jgi:hypothetical protein
MFENDWTQAAARQRERISGRAPTAGRATSDPDRPRRSGSRVRRIRRWRALILGGLVLAAPLAALVVTLPSIVLASGEPRGGSEVDVFPIPARFQPPAGAAGASTLIRGANGVAGTLRLDGLTPLRATTVWWVVFNRPAGCAAACDTGDLFDDTGALAPNPEARISLIWAAGQLPASSSAAFDLHLDRGSENDAVFGPGLLDPAGAEIHLLVRTHGPALGGDTRGERLKAQLTSYEGGCATNRCRNTHLAIHRP